MKKIPFVLLMLAFLLPHASAGQKLFYEERQKPAINIVEDINTPCASSTELYGCIVYDKNEIYIDSHTAYPFIIHVISHELGHWYMKNTSEVDYRKYFNFRSDGYVDNYTLEELRENAAETFAFWTLNELERVPVKSIKKPYYKFRDTPNVFETSTHDLVSFEIAKARNIWRKIQMLPMDQPTVLPMQIKFFEKIVL